MKTEEKIKQVILEETENLSKATGEERKNIQGWIEALEWVLR